METKKWLRILYLISLFIPGKQKQKWVHERFSDASSARSMPDRILNLMKATYQDASFRISEMQQVRFMYEKTPHYEVGFVFGEIIERYQKMTLQLKRAQNNKNNVVYDMVDRVESIQKLFFEIFHLVNIMHEIPRKYMNETDFRHLTEGGEEFARARLAKEAFEAAEKQRLEQVEVIKKKQKKLQKRLKLGVGFIQEILNKSSNKITKDTKLPKSLKGTFYKRWPIDYGWEPEKW